MRWMIAKQINDLSKHGEFFVQRLRDEARNPNRLAARLVALKSKIAVVQKMYVRTGG